MNDGTNEEVGVRNVKVQRVSNSREAKCHVVGD